MDWSEQQAKFGTLIQPRTAQPKAQPNKGPGGVKGFLINSLPAIGGGLGAVAGIPGDLFSAGGASVAGGAIGAGLGETLKRKVLGEKLDPKQIAIQAGEGGVLSGIGGGVKAASGAAKSFVKGGAEEAAQTATKTVPEKSGSFMKDLTTQGQQMQGRGLGISAGNKEAGKTLFPQDTAKMLDTLKAEAIPIKTANSTASAVKDKLDDYGKNIADYFKTNSAPLHPEDTKVIADNFIKSLGTTDPRVLKEADVLANDLQKNVKSTKDLWEFRKTLDSRIPDTKQATDVGLSNKIAATKSMRQYISKELGEVPGMSNYHDLADIKQFLPKGMRELNQPSGGIVGRVLSSGPVQKVESAAGKRVEQIGKIGEQNAPSITSGAEATPPITNVLNRILATAKNTATLPVRAAAAPLAFPVKSAAQVGKQELGRGLGIPASISNQSQDNSVSPVDTTSNVSPDNSQPLDANDPFSSDSIQNAVLQDLQQNGGKNVATLLSLFKTFGPQSDKPLNSSQQQQANNANSALQDIQSISDMLDKDPSISAKAAIPTSIAHRLTGTTDYEAARSNVVDVISRLRSGAAISASEEKLYKSLLPGPADSSESAKAKLNRLTELFSSFANPQSTGGTDITDLASNGGL